MSTSDALLLDAHGERTLYIGPSLCEGLPAEVLEGLARRRLVALGQPCPEPCGARLTIPNRAARRAAVRAGRVLSVAVEHEDDCPALDPRIDGVTTS